VIGHTDCGLQAFTDEQIAERIEAELGVSVQSRFLAFADVEASVADSVERIKGCELLPRTYRAHGFVYDVRSGRLRQVA